mmetsp:Transcript_154208/g.269761  ORF Transcript_154208/g.269761 Transcript_154208/m.269761 type:complete len:162 (-) Transcript_154208:950-1435(-)
MRQLVVATPAENKCEGLSSAFQRLMGEVQAHNSQQTALATSLQSVTQSLREKQKAVSTLDTHIAGTCIMAMNTVMASAEGTVSSTSSWTLCSVNCCDGWPSGWTKGEHFRLGRPALAAWTARCGTTTRHGSRAKSRRQPRCSPCCSQLTHWCSTCAPIVPI